MQLIWACVVRNSISLICFTALAIIFGHWWIVFFSLLFLMFPEYKSKQKKDEGEDKT